MNAKTWLLTKIIFSSMRCCSDTSQSQFQISHSALRFKRPSMGDLVGETLSARRVSRVEFGCDFALLFIAVAMLASSIALFILNQQEPGMLWTYGNATLYAGIGGMGCIGATLTFLSTKWICHAVKKHYQYLKDMTEVS